MKNLLMIITLLWSFVALAQESGIQFHKDATWADLLAKAKAENKLIVVDAYTTWCGPCKWMDAHVFKNEEVGQFYNANFINAKFDMEKGEGLELAKTYAVQAYPTILYIDGSGATMHRVVGGRDAAQFIAVGKTALDPDQRLAGLEKRFDGGERDPAFIAATMQAFADAMHPRVHELLEVYLDANPTNASPQLLEMLLTNTRKTDSKGFKYILANRALIEKELGKQAFIATVQNIILMEAFPNITQQTLPALPDVQKALQAKLPADVADEAYLNIKMNFARFSADKKAFAQSALAYYKKYPATDFQGLNAAAWDFYELVDDPAALKEAVKWAQQSVQLNSQSFNNDTLAALYFKTGDKKNAKKYAEKAIELAKANGEDYSATQELLEKINTMK